MNRTHPYRKLISFVTDIEGNMKYLDAFVGISSTVRWATQSDTPRKHLPTFDRMTHATTDARPSAIGDSSADLPRQGRPANRALDLRDRDSHFVYGGDAFDHGDDLTFARTLLDLKAKHPDRVHLVLGNRDINKMVMSPGIESVGRYKVAEAEQHLFQPCHHWRAPAESYEQHLARRKLLSPGRTHADPITFLQWALIHKLGSPNSFEHRRQELQSQRFHPSAPITDEEVAESFFAAARPGGLYDQYTQQGVLMVGIDNTLFVHGAIRNKNVGFVPSISTTSVTAQPTCGRYLVSEGHDVNAWIAALETFKRDSLSEWRERRGHGGEALRQYAYPRASVPYSVTVASFVESNGLCHASLSVAGYLLSSGYHTVCSGHQPVGDTPAIVRQPGGFLMLCADNSYCGRSGTMDRAAAVQEVLIESTVGPVRVHGRRADGHPFSFSVVEDQLLGRCAGDGWWVKVPLWQDPAAARGADYDLCRNTTSHEMLEATHYELHRTTDAFRTEEVIVVPREDVVRRLWNYSRGEHQPLPGALRQEFTPQELKAVYRQRIKTKVSRASTTIMGPMSVGGRMGVTGERGESPGGVD